MKEESVLPAKLQGVTTKNCSVANYQGADRRKLPSGLDKLQQKKALSKCSEKKKNKLEISKTLSIK